MCLLDLFFGPVHQAQDRWAAWLAKTKLRIFFHLIILILAAGQFDCTFETGFCTWTQGAAADFNWTRNSGGTASVNTGPAEDHTLKTSMFLSNICI